MGKTENIGIFTLEGRNEAFGAKRSPSWVWAYLYTWS